jgi:hypothetical protein
MDLNEKKILQFVEYLIYKVFKKTVPAHTTVPTAHTTLPTAHTTVPTAHITVVT